MERMTGYDVFVILVVLASAASGAVRGGVREIVTLLSFILAAFLTLVALPYTAPVGRALVEPEWAGSILAAVLSFLVVYFGIRILGSVLSKRAQAHPQLGGIDRGLGVIVGGGRALVLVGAVHLVIAAALPGERTPRWLSEAGLYGVSAGSARAIQWILPGIGQSVDAVTPALDSSVRRGFGGDDALPPTQSAPTSPPDS